MTTRGDAHPISQSPFIPCNSMSRILSFLPTSDPIHMTIGCGKQGFPSAQPYLSHTPPIHLNALNTNILHPDILHELIGASKSNAETCWWKISPKSVG
ncbi:hypothetical protein N7505_004165 [Penicillium chrysogenum]|uniref:Uncharacterized protein n=1 Tax=Penicillium chrysogenum TaxID=5076 RepID=A0ABQ8WSM0_PENCH|nr:hypothetical protein N7505_004165 [Penicillium chrysogenum]